MKPFNHKGNHFAFSITGGGAGFAHDILTAGGASEYLIEIFTPYSTESLEDFVGGVRESYCSESAARQMAISSEMRGNKLGFKNSIGIGATCSLAKVGGERDGRVHRVYVAASKGSEIISFEWENGDQSYDRKQGDEVASSIIKNVAEIFAEHCSKKSHLEKSDIKEKFMAAGITRPNDKVQLNVACQYFSERLSPVFCDYPRVTTENEVAFENLSKQRETICIFPGSFNPPHADHERVFRNCEEIYGPENCFFEISVTNVEKPRIDMIELQKRCNALRKISPNILISNAPTFEKKFDRCAWFGKRLVFAVGCDTLDRIERGAPGWYLAHPRNGRRVEKDLDYGLNIEVASFYLAEGDNLSSSSIRKNKNK